MENTELTVTSENTSVITVEGYTLTAVAPGTSTVTVTAEGLSDEVEITVSEPQPVLNTVTIANEDELAADWYPGEGDRTVEVSYDPSEHFNADNTPSTVTSDNEDVIAVDGMKLTAKAAGTAKITVTAGGKTDEVTLTVKPVLTSLTITNKTELSAAWSMNGGEREVAYEYSPANFEGAQVSITSSAPEIVEVKDGKLIAKGVGEATITVTVKTDEPREKSATDSVTVTVSPVLNAVTIANEDKLAADWYLGEGDRTVEVSYDPAEHFNADNTPATVTSDNEDVIAVDGMKLTAKAAGTAKITVTAGGKTDEVTLTVKPVLTSLTITNKTELSAAWPMNGGEREVAYEYSPANFEGAQVSIVSSAPEIVEVKDGKLIAKGVGDATITVTVKTDEPREKSATDSVTVIVSPVLNTVAIANEDELAADWYLGEGDRTVEVSYDPAEHFNADNTPATVTSDNEDVIAVDGMKLTAKAAGTAKITVTAGGKTNEVTLTVKPVLTSLTITNKTELSARWAAGDADRTLSVTYEPEGFAGAIVSYLSSAPDIISVDENGKLTAKAAGTATITVTVKTDEPREKSATDSIEITVLPALSGISVLNEETLKGRWIVGEADRTVEIGYAPAEHYNAENTPATVTSDNEDVIAVDGMKLTAKGAGAAKITVTAGGKTAVVEIVVIPELTDVTIAGLNAEETLDYQATKQFTVSPADSANYTFEQAGIFVVSDNTGIVTLTAGENGSYTLNAVGVGETTITVTARNNITKTIRVTVVPTAPMLTVETNALEGLEDTAFRIPTATATACDGKDLSYEVKVFRGGNGGGEDDALLPDAYKDGAVTVPESGEYSIVYTATDTRGADLTASKTVLLTASRQVFGAVAGKKMFSNPDWGQSITIDYEDGAQLVADDQQKLSTSESDIVLAQFNMEASEYYYAEVTFTLEGTDYVAEKGGDILLGMTHSLPAEEGDLFPEHWLAAYVDRGSSDTQRNFKIKDLDLTGNDPNWNILNSDYFAYRNRLVGYGGLTDADACKLTMAIIRDGAYFYTFVNGQFAMMFTAKEYTQPTIPGIIGFKLDPGQADVVFENIVYFGGEANKTQVEEKLGELYTTKVFAYHLWQKYDKISTDPDGEGVNFTFTDSWGAYANPDDNSSAYNSGGATSYTVFEGDFKVEWDYVNTNAVTEHKLSWAFGAFLTVTDASDYTIGANSNDLIKLGAFISKSKLNEGAVNGFLHGSPSKETLEAVWVDTKPVPDFGDGTTYDAGSTVYTPYAFQNNDKIHFSLTRRIVDGKSEYEMVIKVDDKTITRTVTIDHADPVMLTWQNGCCAGTCSNITWEALDSSSGSAEQ